MANFYKDWETSPSLNNGGDVPFYRPIDLTPAEKEQACKNIGVASNDAIERLEDEFTDLRGDMATVSSDVASAVANANSALASASDATTAAQAAIASITGYATDLATVSSKADTNSGNITTLSSDVSTLSANVGSISGKNTSQDTKIGELSSSVAGLTNSAVYHEAVINNLTTAWTAYSADLKNDFDTWSATEDAVITAATAAIPGQVSAEVSGQLSGKQDKLTSANAGVNISISNAGVIDVNNNTCSAGGAYAIALGYRTNAAHYGSFTHGASTKTLSSYAHAEGDNTRAYYMAHSEGITTSALGSYSHAEGDSTIASGNYSHAEGLNTSALAQYSHAEGSTTKSIGQASHAEGVSASADGNGAHAEGQQTYAHGQRSHTEGYGTYTNTNYGHAEGFSTSSWRTAAHSEGNATQASGEYSHAEGNATNAIGNYSHAEGNITFANGIYSHAEGDNTSAYGQTSHAEGYNTSAGYRSHAEGGSTFASVAYAHAEGQDTVASAQGAHAEGFQTTAIANYAHTEGAATTATYQYSHAEGRFTITDTQYQHVEGQFNAPATGALHVIGNGTANDARSNALEVYTNQIIANVPVYATNIPSSPTTNGVFNLQTNVNNGNITYDWVSTGTTEIIGDKHYRTVEISGKEWMAENLDLIWEGLIIDYASPHMSAGAWYYNRNSADYGHNRKYNTGLLYNGSAMKYLNENISALCPGGWRIPTYADYMAIYNPNSSTVPMKAVDNSNTTNFPSGWGGTNTLGLNIYPGGYYYNSFYNINDRGYLWTSNTSISSQAHRVVFKDDTTITTGAINLDNACSIRLVRDV